MSASIWVLSETSEMKGREARGTGYYSNPRDVRVTNAPRKITSRWTYGKSLGDIQTVGESLSEEVVNC
jgi:hypothetical protein